MDNWTLVLPNGVWTRQTASTKRYIFYTDEGLDIRDNAGSSMGERKPTVTGKNKNCTLPISSLVLHANIEDEDDQQFLEHWEDVTGFGH
jgi:hypothetical protein